MGVKLEIVKWPDPRLLETAAQVRIFDQELRDLVSGMLKMMYSAGGIGLAAPQVGIPLRVIVFNFGARGVGAATERVMVNPRVVHTSLRTTSMTEMCLSCPGVMRRVERPKIARLEWDHVSEPIRNAAHPTAETFRGLAARIALHEYDHLEGRVIASE